MAPMELIDGEGRRIHPRFYIFRRMDYRYRYQVGDGLVGRRTILRDFLVRDYHAHTMLQRAPQPQWIAQRVLRRAVHRPLLPGVRDQGQAVARKSLVEGIATWRPRIDALRGRQPFHRARAGLDRGIQYGNAIRVVRMDRGHPFESLRVASRDPPRVIIADVKRRVLPVHAPVLAVCRVERVQHHFVAGVHAGRKTTQAFDVTAIGAARRIGLTVEERAFTVEEMYAAQEVFFASTTLWTYPIVSVEDRPIGSGKGGPVARMIRDALMEEFERGVQEPAAPSPVPLVPRRRAFDAPNREPDS